MVKRAHCVMNNNNQKYNQSYRDCELRKLHCLVCGDTYCTQTNIYVSLVSAPEGTVEPECKLNNPTHIYEIYYFKKVKMQMKQVRHIDINILMRIRQESLHR